MVTLQLAEWICVFNIHLKMITDYLNHYSVSIPSRVWYLKYPTLMSALIWASTRNWKNSEIRYVFIIFEKETDGKKVYFTIVEKFFTRSEGGGIVHSVHEFNSWVLFSLLFTTEVTIIKNDQPINHKLSDTEQVFVQNLWF